MKVEIRFLAPLNVTIEVADMETAVKAAHVIAQKKGATLLGVAPPEYWLGCEYNPKPVGVKA